VASNWLAGIAFFAPPQLAGNGILYKFPGASVYCVTDVSGDNQTGTGWCERLYDEKAAELVLYGRALGLSHSGSEDVVQETFVALLRLEQCPNQPERYCIRSFRNRALNYRRNLWRRLVRELESRRWFERAPNPSPYEPAAMRCLADLPVEQREVIVLKIWHEYTFEEIGELLATSPNTVAGRYRYGLQKLRACLKGEAYEREGPIGSAVAFLDSSPPLPET